MKRNDFIYIPNFTIREIEETGANIQNIKYKTIERLQLIRTLVRSPIYLLYNGLTTGDHSSPYHDKGKAVDWYTQSDLPLTDILMIIMSVNFKGVGIYKCKETGIYTFHTDIGDTYRQWSAYKDKKEENWNYKSLFNLP